MEIFPLKRSRFPWDRNASEAELLERTRTAVSYHPKRKTADPRSIQPAGMLSQGRSTPTASSLSTEQGPVTDSVVLQLLEKCCCRQLCDLEMAFMCHETPLHQPAISSPPPGTLKFSTGLQPVVPLTWRLSPSRKHWAMWGINSFCSQSTGCTASVTPFHSPCIWTVLLSASGG